MDDVAKAHLRRLAEMIRERHELEKKFASTTAVMLRAIHTKLVDPRLRYTERQQAIAMIAKMAQMLEDKAEPLEEVSNG